MSIVWLSSYPKSGNTWTRLFLESYRWGADDTVDLNRLRIRHQTSGRWICDEATGIATTDLTADELDELRPDIYRRLVRHTDETVYLKVHEVYGTTTSGRPVFPADVTRAAVHVVRNPLDVVLSLDGHYGLGSVDLAIELLGRSSHVACGRADRADTHVRHRVGSWSDNVRSWTEGARELDVHVVRYEDALAAPTKTFGQLLEAIGIEVDEDELERAVLASSFPELQRQEVEHGFRERPAHLPRFFRSGRAGVWREKLTRRQIERVVEEHGEVMDRMGYLRAAREYLDG